jgi:hypothetical protein
MPPIPFSTEGGGAAVPIPVTVDALVRGWVTLATAEAALDQPFTRAASCAIDLAIVVLSDLEEAFWSTASVS